MEKGAVVIEVIKIPEGPAPEKIRQMWVGLKMVAHKITDEIETDFENNPIGNRNGFIVFIEVALMALKNKSCEAVEWFQKNIPPGMPWLSFGPDEVRIIEEL